MKRVLIAGSKDLGTACAVRLFRSGMRVTIVTSDRPLDIHYLRTFSGAVHSGSRTIDGTKGITISGAIESGELEPDISVKSFVDYQHADRKIAILTAADISSVDAIQSDYFVITDEDVFQNIRSMIRDEAKLIGFSGNTGEYKPNYLIGVKPPHTGKVLYPFIDDVSAEDDKPVDIRLNKNQVKAPLEGVFTASKQCGDHVFEKDEVGRIGEIPILSPEPGHITGLLNSGIIVKAGEVFAEISHAVNKNAHMQIPDYNFSLAGGVLEAVMYDQSLNRE
ncbi:MAG: hypothetical protein AB7T22_09795 [Calditrichaceae bacterium]